MVGNEELEYKIAFAEVDDVLELTEPELIKLIPQKFRQFLKDNRDVNYKIQLNPEKSLKEQNISEKAKAIIALIYKDYFASENELIALTQKLDEEFKLEKEKYNPDKIFEDNKKVNIDVIEDVENEKIKSEDDSNTEENDLVVYKNNISVIFIDFIKNIFNKIKNYFKVN